MIFPAPRQEGLNMRRRIALMFAGIAVMMPLLAGCKVEYAENMTSAEADAETETTAKVIRVRYSDEKYTDYIKYCEEEYEKNNEGIDIVPELVSSDNYINNINSDSAAGGSVPDVYMAANSDLGTLYLAGLAYKNTSDVYNTDNYCEAALDACSYNKTLVAYPLAYRTSFLLYNTKYLTAEDTVSFAAMETYSENADFFSSEESASVESVFRCEVSDLFTNYAFISPGLVIGGAQGDNADSVSIVNDTTKAAAKEYMSLIDYFSISTKNTYNGCMKKFLSGKFLSVIATTDSLSTIAESKIECGVAAFPDYNSKLSTKPLSITTALVVNPYSSDVSEASKFAEFATAGMKDVLYSYTGMLSAASNVEYEDTCFADIYASYAKSMPKNKLVYGEQIYPLLEIAMHNIAAGEDIEEQLSNVSDYMKSQLN